MDYLAYHFIVNPPQPGSEILTAMIGEMGFDSFEQMADGFVAYIPATIARKVDLSELSFVDFSFSYTVEELKATNWNKEWESNFEPVFVGDQLCIRAPFHTPDNRCKHEIVIMPKMSFGTGHHQTTRLMCSQMFKLPLTGSKVLDMGCGTGILSILATKLGAKEVLGIDIDAWSVDNARENCNANGCASVKLIKGDAKDLRRLEGFDYVLANINRNVLKAQMTLYARILKPGGELLTSGFFTTDADELEKEASKSGFGLMTSDNENEWAMLRFRKPAPGTIR